jgi:CheY-like chemotaxis protein
LDWVKGDWLGYFFSGLEDCCIAAPVILINAYMESKFVLAIVSDLFFVVKIGDAAKRAGLSVTFISDLERAMEKVKERPVMVLIDLNNDRAEPVELVTRLKGSGIPMIGYLSHVQVDLKKKVEEAGCDRVLARSTVSEKLGEIFAGL